MRDDLFAANDGRPYAMERLDDVEPARKASSRKLAWKYELQNRCSPEAVLRAQRPGVEARMLMEVGVKAGWTSRGKSSSRRRTAPARHC